MMKKIRTEAISDNSSSSVMKVAGTEDLVREILLRLPVRSLFNFFLVSKHWLSLSTDPQFLSQHFHRNPSSNPVSGLFFYNSLTSTNPVQFISFPNSLNPPSRVRVSVPSFSFLNLAAKGGSFKIIQSCNGLLLCQLAYQSSDSTREYCVCNPTTKKYTIIPPPSTISHEKAFGFSLAFDPSVSLHYKVVCIRPLEPPYNGIAVDIYSSESSNWKTCNRMGTNNYKYPDGLRGGDLGKGIYWNGSINWIKQDPGDNHCFRFDIKKEIMYCRRIDFCTQPLRYFGESNGCLLVISIRSNSAKLFRVLERDRETQTWVVKYRVHICHLLSAFPEICQEFDGIKEYSFSILSVYKGEKEEDSAMLMTIPGKVISYNLHYKKAKVLHELPSMTVDTSHYDPISGFNFVECLAPV